MPGNISDLLHGYEYFKREILTLTGIDLSSYKEAQMKRRIDTLISKHKIVGYDKYIYCLRTDKAMFEEFVNYITINVSEFYRDSDQWKVMEDKAVPELIARFGRNLRIWSAACSTGDEPYSLVLALSRHLPLANIRIHATDLDKQVIARARTGLYPEKSITAVPLDLKNKYFRREGDSYRISNEVKACVEFREHNLLKDPYPAECHLIVCRNVLIYFTEEAKDVIYRKFNASLKQGCFLFVGSTEQIIQPEKIGYDTYQSFFYRKK